jgi:DNA-binding transcriptional ArsR family regulator
MMGKKKDGLSRLRFACECVSARGGYSDPWAAVAQHKLLPDGTKEDILNLVAQEPRTISQLARGLDLSAPSVYAHVNEMLASELLREAVEREKSHPAERYYEPNFPVIKDGEGAEMEALCRDLAERVAHLFENRGKQLERAFNQTALSEQGWQFAELAQYLYAKVQRGARQLLEERGVLPPRAKHRNGTEWVFWAEEAMGSDD